MSDNDNPAPQTHSVGPLTYDEVEEIILRTEPPGMSDRDDQIWTRRMAVALADLFNKRLAALTTEGQDNG